MDLQKLRLSKKVYLDFSITGDPQNKTIAPLVLTSFIENAFKYGISTKETSKLLFEVKANADNISFTAQNHVVLRDKGNDDNTGIGLKNTKRRLELLYPDKHKLTVTDENNQFIVHLILFR